MGIYARLLAQGASMCDVDKMDLFRYLDVLAYEVEQAEKAKEDKPPEKGGKPVVMMRRGYIDDVFG